MLKLTDALRTNIENIDNQHSELLRMCSEIQELCDLPSHIDRYDEIVRLVQELKDYTVDHFSYEESLMMEIGYRKYFSHHIVHKNFIDKINEINLIDIDENQQECLRDLAILVSDWIVGHIAKEDMLYSSIYKEYQKNK